MDPKVKVTLPFGFSDAIMTLVVFLHFGDSYSQLLCVFYNNFLMINMKDPWLYLKCVQPWHDEMIAYANPNPHAEEFVFVCPFFDFVRFGFKVESF